VEQLLLKQTMELVLLVLLVEQEITMELD